MVTQLRHEKVEEDEPDPKKIMTMVNEDMNSQNVATAVVIRVTYGGFEIISKGSSNAVVRLRLQDYRNSEGSRVGKKPTIRLVE